MRESHRIIASRVGGILKGLRGGLTQAEYAESLGISQVQYNRYETGKRLAPDRVLEAAAARAGVGLEGLLWGGADVIEAPDPPPQEDLVGAVAALAGLLDPEGLEDLYHFLQLKVESLNQRRRRTSRRAAEALAHLKRRAG